MTSRGPVAIGAHALIGGVSLLVDLGLLVLLHGIVGLPLLPATATAFAASVVVNFTLNRALHLAGPGAGTHRQLLRYGTLLGANAVVTLGIVSFGQQARTPYLLSKLVAVALTTAWNFPLYRAWVFA
ncbi:MAG: putative rane protein [Frankiales bacterium]|nr:putative rane protein [Frankiales bacterium]